MSANNVFCSIDHRINSRFCDNCVCVRARACVWVTFFLFLLLLVFVLTVVYIVCVFFLSTFVFVFFWFDCLLSFLGHSFFSPLRWNGVAAVVCQDDDDYALMSQTASYSNWLLVFLWTFHNSIFYFVWNNWMAHCALFALILILIYYLWLFSSMHWPKTCVSPIQTLQHRFNLQSVFKYSHFEFVSRFYSSSIWKKSEKKEKKN